MVQGFDGFGMGFDRFPLKCVKKLWKTLWKIAVWIGRQGGGAIYTQMSALRNQRETLDGKHFFLNNPATKPTIVPTWELSTTLWKKVFKNQGLEWKKA